MIHVHHYHFFPRRALTFFSLETNRPVLPGGTSQFNVHVVPTKMLLVWDKCVAFSAWPHRPWNYQTLLYYGWRSRGYICVSCAIDRSLMRTSVFGVRDLSHVSTSFHLFFGQVATLDGTICSTKPEFEDCKVKPMLKTRGLQRFAIHLRFDVGHPAVDDHLCLQHVKRE